MEIERKFLISTLPEHLEQYDHYDIEQAYLNENPVIRIRKNYGSFVLTYKGSGMLAHEEYNLPITEEGYQHLLQKADGKIIQKTRYKIPFEKYLIELDVFHGALEGTLLAEVEFETLEEAENFQPPQWFQKDVTYDIHYHNVHMALYD